MFHKKMVGIHRSAYKAITRGAAVIMIITMLSPLAGAHTQQVSADSTTNGDVFSLAWTSNENLGTDQVAWGDMDNDGYLDQASADAGYVRIYHNNSGVLSQAGTPIDSGSARTIAWGDVNGDGFLDLMVGGPYGLILFINHSGVLQRSTTWLPVEQDIVNSIAWGDVDGDGWPDLAVGTGTLTNKQSLRIYMNSGGALSTSAVWLSSVKGCFTSVAWGDVDGDGKLDLAVGENNAANNVSVYRNDTIVPGLPIITESWSPSPPVTDNAMNVAWGDYDKDDHLDLAVGFGNGPYRVYHNLEATLGSMPAWTTPSNSSWGGLAWGDVNNDGYLDLVVSANPIRLHLNQAGTLSSTSAWSPIEIDTTSFVALGDADNDGNLDLAVANFGSNNNEPNRLYHNNGISIQDQPLSSWLIPRGNPISSLAWGDMDNDGDLDLAAGNAFTYTALPAILYRNNNGVLSSTSVWSSTETGNVTSVAWGDINNDGYLDLAVGFSPGVVRLYLNHGGTLDTTADWSPDIPNDPNALAFADFNNDGYLDLAASGRWLQVYKNDNGQFPTRGGWSPLETYSFNNLAWGDVDGDGSLDLAASSVSSGRIFLYRNMGGELNPEADLTWNPIGSGTPTSLAWGDFNSDGKPDLAVGNRFALNRVYFNTGGALSSTAAWSSNEVGDTVNVRSVDYDADGDPDLVTAGMGFARIYRNDHGILTSNAAWQLEVPTINGGEFHKEQYTFNNVAWGDINGDGDLDMAGAAYTNIDQSGQLYLYPNVRDGQGFPGTIPVVSVSNPSPQADFYSAGVIQSGIIPISYTLTSAKSDNVAGIYAWYSPDGGGRWLPAQPTPDTSTTNLSSSPAGMEHTFEWDVNASGFFGQSDNVIVRIQAVAGSTNHANSVPGPFLRGSYAAQSLPFRVRGTQILVVDETDQPVSSAVVYRLPNGQANGAKLITAPDGTPFVTAGNGFLQGRGELQIGDQLVALQPIDTTCPDVDGTISCHTVYFTSAPVTYTGLDAQRVNDGGVQTLVVSDRNPLILFNLDVSLEWDARQDTQFLQQLRFDLQRTSELLYDWSNGQVALGQVTLNHDRGDWADADVRIYATDNRRPLATMGGVVTSSLIDPDNEDMVYQPGMVHMGRVWSRYGLAGSSTGEDWPRALAHELGHYALFLNDDYLGLDQNGLLVNIDSCTGTAMTDPYRDDYSEFRHADTWLNGCQDTLANQTTGRSDWSTIKTFYPDLLDQDTNNEDIINPGPSSLPLAVTQIIEVAPNQVPLTLPDPRFYLKDDAGASLQPGSSARAILYRADRLEDLGAPMVDSVLAPGAQPGDQICVFYFSDQRVGCKTVLPSDNQQLELRQDTDWLPDVLLTPLNDRTVDVKVRNLASGLSLAARLYSGDGSVSAEISLVPSASNYTGTFNLGQTTENGIVLIWQTDEPQHVAISDYSMGGSLAEMRSGFTRVRSGFAPAVSSDGQVFLYADNLDFPPNQFYTLQAATTIPDVPAWTSQTGQAYWLSKSIGAPELTGASISMGYSDKAVTPEEESWLKIYRWNETTQVWEVLDTHLNTVENYAVAIVPGAGLYSLISTIDIPLYGPGWDQFSFPLQTVRPVGTALLSIAGSYNSVYWYNSSNPANPWTGYSPYVPDWVNDLADLQFGKVYWINLTQNVTLKLNARSASSPLLAGPATPPATFYGEVKAMAGFLPQAGLPVTAWINGVNCGSSVTQIENGKVVYSIHVLASGPSSPGCGLAGNTVQFTVGEQHIFATATWDYSQFWPLDIQPTQYQFIPLVIH